MLLACFKYTVIYRELSGSLANCSAPKMQKYRQDADPLLGRNVKEGVGRQVV